MTILIIIITLIAMEKDHLDPGKMTEMKNEFTPDMKTMPNETVTTEV